MNTDTTLMEVRAKLFAARVILDGRIASVPELSREAKHLRAAVHEINRAICLTADAELDGIADAREVQS